MERIREAARVLRTYLLRAIAAEHRLLPLDPDDATAETGYIDRIVFRDGECLIEGWTRCERLRFETELGIEELAPDLRRDDVTARLCLPETARPGFSFTIAAERRLRVSMKDEDGWRDRPEIALAGTVSRVRGALSGGLRLARFGAANLRPILRYFVNGDAEAGRWLEEALVPRASLTHHPPVPGDLFMTASARDAGPHSPVTVIVPVYDAFESLCACLDRLARHTGDSARLIIVDDASRDPRVRPMLRRFAETRAQVLLLENERNLGFPATVNRALAHRAGQNVVLVNSDALVPAGWLDRLIRPIETDPTVASVTPMSNDAEIFTAPVLSQPGPVDGGTVDRLDAVAARLDPVGASAEAPTGVGFCMALSGRFLDRLPTFDEGFGRGYGEEVDWCRKASAIGGRHVGIGNLYVGHLGGESFSTDEKRRLMQRHNAVIRRRYPDYEAEVERFKRTDPLAGPRLALALAWLAEGLPVPVYLAHNLGGGAEVYLRSRIARELTHVSGAVVLRPAREAGRIRIEVHTGAGVTRGEAGSAEVLWQMLEPLDGIHLIYSCLVEAPDPLEILDATAGRIRAGHDRLSILFHDFYPICPSKNLIDADGQFCDLPDQRRCQSCYSRLEPGPDVRPGDILEWRSAWHGHLLRADELVAFSRSSAQLIARAFPDCADKVTLQPHQPEWVAAVPAPPAGGRLVIGVLGDTGYSKGAAILKEIAALAEPDLDLVVIGKIDPRYGHSGIRVHGPYSRGQIAELAARYGLSCWLIPAIWPETFSYATHEALATGLPVFCFDLGAQAEAVAAAPNGTVLSYPPPSAAEIVAAIRPAVCR